MKLEELITKVLANSFNIDGFLDELALAYWVAINIGDERRTSAIHDLIATVIERGRIHRKPGNKWNVEEIQSLSDPLVLYARVSALDFDLLANINVSYLTPEVQKLLRNTQGYLARKPLGLLLPIHKSLI